MNRLGIVRQKHGAQNIWSQDGKILYVIEKDSNKKNLVVIRVDIVD